jgi:hypothetical protein
MNRSLTYQPRMTEPDPREMPLGAGIDWTDPNSRLAPYYLGPSHVFVAGLLVVIFALANRLPMWHNDVWISMSYGRWMIENQRLPEREPFSKYSSPTSVTHHEWLTDLIFYGAMVAGERLAGGDELNRLAGGVENVRFLHGLLVLARCLLLLAAFRRASGSLPLAAVGLCLYIILQPSMLTATGGQELGLLAFAVLLVITTKDTLTLRTCIAVGATMIAWVNCHDSFLYGLALLLVVGIGRFANALRDRGELSAWRLLAKRQVLIALGLVPFAAAAVCVNPYGARVYLAAAEFFQNPNAKMLSDFQPLDFSLSPGGHWAYMIILGTLLVSQLLSRRPMSLLDLFLLVTFGVAPLFHQRMLVWWGLLAIWIAMPLWADIGVRFRLRATPSKPSFLRTIYVMIFGALAMLLSTPAQWALARQPSTTLDASVTRGTAWKLAAELTADRAASRDWIPELRQEINRRFPNGKFQGRVFASESIADYLVWSLPSEMRPTIYTQINLFSKEHWQRVVDVKVGGSLWTEELDRWNANVVVIEGTKIHRKLIEQLRESPDWIVVTDGTSNQRFADPRNQLVIAIRKEVLR